MSELYSIVRGKAGKSVEFGIKWGISRIDGFAMGFVMNNIANLSDKKFCIDAIQKHIEIFGTAPTTYGFDRGGHSAANIKKAKKLGVKNGSLNKSLSLNSIKINQFPPKVAIAVKFSFPN